MKKPPYHVLEIANSDQCCYCGACLGVCPGTEDRNLNILDINNDGWKLKIDDEEKCTKCTLCIDACPMHVINFKELDEQIYNNEKKNLNRPYFRSLYRNWHWIFD